MAENCLNCGNVILENFCGSCGQKKFKRIDRKYLFDEIQYTVLHANKGLLYSLKGLLKNPGKTAREYINGNRVNHYKPILMVFVLAGISTFLTFKVLGGRELLESAFKSTSSSNRKFMEGTSEFVSHYYSLITLALIPFLAFITKITFRKWGNNYYEHVVINAYILSSQMLLGILFVDPFLFLFNHVAPKVSLLISQYNFLILIPLVLVWFFKGFYNEKPLKTIVLKVLVAIGLFLLGYLVILFIGILVGIAVVLTKGPGALNLIKPK